MPSEPQSLPDVLIDHGIGLERYSNAVVRRIIAIIDRAIADVEDQIRKRLKGMNATGMDAIGSDRLKKLLEDLKAINIEAQALLRARLYGDMEAIAAAEAEFSKTMFEQVAKGAGMTVRLGSPTAATLKAVVYSQPFQGRVLKEWAARRSADFLDRITTQIKLGVVEGDSIDMIIDRITGPGGVDRVLRRNTASVIRTAVNHISNRVRASVASQTPDLFEGYRWVSVLDSRTTPICRARDGKVYAFDSGPMPPAHFNCLPGDALVLSRHGVTGASKRWFDGEVIVIKTASGRELVCTPNHPVLTIAGWVAAGLLDVGGDVISDGGGEWVATPIDGDGQHMPASIHKVAETFLGSGKVTPMPMPTAAEDFHGDGMAGEVAIVGAYRERWIGADAALDQHGLKPAFVMGTATGTVGGDRCRALDLLVETLLTAARCGIRGCGEALALLLGASGHSDGLLLAAIPAGNSLFAQHRRYGADTASEVLAYAGGADSGFEHGYDFIGRELWGRWPARAHGASRLAQSPVDDIDADASLAREIMNGAFGKVFADKIVYVERRDFSGHVFNLETTKGFYSANGIVTHNCRSSILPVLKGVTPVAFKPYPTWLREQPREVVYDIMGQAKGKLFLDGGLRIDRFVDATGREYTIEELRRRNAAAFERAGLAA